jgi:hypothetical protein
MVRTTNSAVAVAALAATLAAASCGAQESAAGGDGFVGEWRITVDRGGAARVGVLEVVETDAGLEAFIDGGPAPVELDGDRIVLTMDWEDGGGLYHVSRLEGALVDGAIEGPQTENDQPQGMWRAVPEIERVTGAPPAPADLSGVWYNTTFDGTAKYTFEMRDDAKAFQASFEPMLDDPSLRCVSDGLPRVTGGPFSKEILQPSLEPDERITILYEDMHSIRRIYMDDREFPEDVQDRYSSMGYSIGHWDGSTLVIETRGFKDMIWHRSGTPITWEATITEHIYRIDEDTLWVDMIVEDPTNYARPLLRTTVWQARPDYEIQEYACDPHAFYRAIALDGRLDEYWGRSEYRR